jgi:hypothetical protein
LLCRFLDAGMTRHSALLPTLGFAVSITALMLFLTTGLQQRPWWQGVITAVVISGVLVVLFYDVLRVPINSRAGSFASAISVISTI